jgi:CCDC81-like prokaryotic HU domain 1
MVIDVAAHISFLLYQNDVVVLPGLGRLSSTYRPAMLDHIHGAIHPPAKTIHFDQDVDSESDMILQSLAQKHHINATQAEILLDDYIHSVLNALSYQEEVDIPKVGKLYKDYEQQVRFLAYDTNFNSTSFGLPQLNYIPLQRAAETQKVSVIPEIEVVEPSQNAAYEHHEQPGVPPKPPKQQSSARSSRWIWLLPAILSLVVAYLAFSWYQVRQQKLADLAKAQVAAMSEQQQVIDLGNKSVEEDNVLENSEIGRGATEELALIAEPSVAREALPKEEAPVVTEVKPKEVAKEKAPKKDSRVNKQKQCIVISGVFKQASNQRQVANALAARGFEVYEDQKNGLYRVGVQFNYSNSADLAAYLNSIKNFAPGSWVYKK